jgi:hypothetical protein
MGELKGVDGGGGGRKAATARANAHDDSDGFSLLRSARCVRSSPPWSSRAQKGCCPIAADFELT